MICGRLVVQLLQRIEPVGVVPSTHLHHATPHTCPLSVALYRSASNGMIESCARHPSCKVASGSRFRGSFKRTHQDDIWCKAHGCGPHDALECLQRCLMPRADCRYSVPETPHPPSESCLLGRCSLASRYRHEYEVCPSARDTRSLASQHQGQQGVCTWHWHIDGVAFSLARARLVNLATPGPHLILVHINEEHRIVLIEEILHQDHPLINCYRDINDISCQQTPCPHTWSASYGVRCFELQHTQVFAKG